MHNNNFAIVAVTFIIYIAIMDCAAISIVIKGTRDVLQYWFMLMNQSVGCTSEPTKPEHCRIQLSVINRLADIDMLCYNLIAISLNTMNLCNPSKLSTMKLLIKTSIKYETAESQAGTSVSTI